MDPLRLSLLGGVAVGAPATSLVIPRPQAGNGQGTAATNAIQGAAPDWLIQALQAAAQAGAQAATGAQTGPGFTDSLLAALTVPSAPTATTSAADTPPAAAAVPPAPPVVTLAGALPATPVIAAAEAAALPQVTLPDSSTTAFALETALRFGAGVAPGAGPVEFRPDLTADPIRDAAAVPRQPALQPQAGGPGPEAYAQPRAAAPQAVNAYRTAAVAEPPAGLDLLA